MDDSLLHFVQEKFDSLTGVYERSAMEDFARTLIAKSRPFSLILIDGDNFKNVNDGYGHKVGDLVITLIAEKLRAAFRRCGVVGRFGGDEFIVIVPDVVGYDDIWRICHDTHARFDDFSVPGHPAIFMTITVGLSRSPNDGSTYETLFEKADKALYRGKQKGRSCFIIYLDEKHRDIKVHSDGSKGSSSMQMHSTIFRLFSQSQDLRESILRLLHFFSASLMIDHVGIQGRSALLFSEVHPLSRGREFSHIDNALISLNMNESSSIFYMNDVKQLLSVHQSTLAKKCEEQRIVSIFLAEISYADTFYGYLRAETTATLRIWQNADMDLLLTAAKALGMALHYQNATLEDVEPPSRTAS